MIEASIRMVDQQPIPATPLHQNQLDITSNGSPNTTCLSRTTPYIHPRCINSPNSAKPRLRYRPSTNGHIAPTSQDIHHKQSQTFFHFI